VCVQHTSAQSAAQDETSVAPDRAFGVGHSCSADPYARGREATAAAVERCGAAPRLVIVFTSGEDRIADLLDGVRATVPGNPAIVGCTTSGELTPAGSLGRGVGVVALGGRGFDVRVEVGRNLSNDVRGAGRHAAHAVSTLTGPHRVLMLLSDGLAAQSDLVRGVYQITGAAVPLVGGAAGDDLTFRQTLQFAGDATGVEVLSDAVIGIGIASTAPIEIGIAHGWRKSGEPMTITSSSGGYIYELDGERATDVFLRCCGLTAAEVASRESPLLWAHQYPLGMSRRSGEDIRTVANLNLDDGSLQCLIDVQDEALVWLMEADDRSMVAAAGDSCRQALARNPVEQPLGVLLFDCAARLSLLGTEGAQAEVQAVIDALGGVPFAGFYSYGEFARAHGARGMHQMTVVSLALW
jgi:hypothetical protein